MCRLYQINTGALLEQTCNSERDLHKNMLPNLPTIMITSGHHSIEVSFRFPDGHHQEFPLTDNHHFPNPQPTSSI